MLKMMSDVAMVTVLHASTNFHILAVKTYYFLMNKKHSKTAPRFGIAGSQPPAATPAIACQQPACRMFPSDLTL